MTVEHPIGLVVTGAPLASRAADVARALVANGWSLTVRISDAGAEWIGPGELDRVAGLPAVSRPQPPGESIPVRPHRLVAFPLTFNTANKVAAGIMDGPVTGLLCDALGSGSPIVATLMVNDRLWRHPAWAGTLGRLDNAGVRFLDPHTGQIREPVPVASGTGDEVARNFDPAWIVDAVAGMPCV